jgi:hypothetical protein
MSWQRHLISTEIQQVILIESQGNIASRLAEIGKKTCLIKEKQGGY